VGEEVPLEMGTGEVECGEPGGGVVGVSLPDSGFSVNVYLLERKK